MIKNVVTLNNGYTIPSIGYGSAIVLTYSGGGVRKYKYWIKNYLLTRKQYKLDISLRKIIKIAPSIGCVLFDTSRAYAGSEYVIGKSLRKISREDYYIITKLCNRDQRKGNVENALRESLKQLGMEYVDLYLMHWPQTDTWLDCWKQMEELYKKGFCKAIGVCNFNIHHFEELKAIAEIMPMVNQIECHPLFTQEKLRSYCKANSIQIMAYTPTARMDERLSKTVLIDIASKYKRSIAQIIIRWHLQIGNIPIVNTSKVDHLKENMDTFNFELSEEELIAINNINIDSRLRYDPDNCDFNKL